MAGKKHQFILGIIVKQLREYGCSIKSVEGKFLGDPNDNIKKIPPKILNHRPDIIGIMPNGQICIGEAKTENDINNTRTKQQITDFLSVEINGMMCQVFWGLPASAKGSFKRLLTKLEVNDYPNLHILFVPDEIINA